MKKLKFRSGIIGNPIFYLGIQNRQVGPSPGLEFPKGNKLAAAENLTPKAHSRRMRALFKGWVTKARIRKGEKVMTFRHKRKARKRKRLRLKETIAKEMRDIQEFARKRAIPAMQKVDEIIANSLNETTVLQAVQILMERGYGKASQTNINANVSGDGKATEIGAKELNDRIAKALQRVEELSRGKKQAPPRPQRSVDLRKLDRDPNSTPLN